MWLLLAPVDAAPCWDDVGTYSVESDHVVVAWDDALAYDHGIDLADRFETAWDEQITARGWRPPPGSDDHHVLVELVRDATQAVTEIRACPDGTEMPVFRMPLEHTYPDALAAHELHHGVQLAYDDQPAWMDEATATWIQWQTVPSDAAWFRDLARRGVLTQGHIPFASSDRSDADVEAHMYGMALFVEHLERQGPGVQAVWEGETYDAWALWSTWLPELMTDAYDVGQPTADAASATLPAAFSADGIGAPVPGTFQVWYLERGAVDPDHGDVRVSLDVDPDAGFVAWLVAERSDGWEAQRFELETGEAALVLSDLSTTVAGAWVIGGPTAGASDETWLWLLDAQAEGAPPSDPDGTRSTTTSSAFREGCSVAVGPWWLAGLLLWVRRR